MCIIPFISLVGITNHVVTTISAFSFIMLLLDRILTLIVNRISNTSYHLQYLYYPGGNETGAKPNLITCVGYIFLSVITTCPLSLSTRNLPPPSPANSCVFFSVFESYRTSAYRLSVEEVRKCLTIGSRDYRLHDIIKNYWLNSSSETGLCL